MFGFGKKKKGDNALNSAFQRISEALVDDDLQIRILGPQQYSYFKSLSAIDQTHNAEGEFGRSLGNPIPTNGPIGTISYLSNLATFRGHRLLFHRVRSFGNIDAYEFVALSGDDWGFFFVDMYHSRKSDKIPDGFKKMVGPQQLQGFNHYWDDFPLGFVEQKKNLPQDLRFLYASIESVAREMTGRDFVRPTLQRLVLAEIQEHKP